jgi:putative addiction module CopG family antidote
MTVELTREQEQFIEQELSTGHFSNRDEVIGEALALLKRQREARAKLQTAVEEGLSDLAAGRGRSHAEGVAESVKQRGRALKEKRRPTTP